LDLDPQGAKVLQGLLLAFPDQWLVFRQYLSVEPIGVRQGLLHSYFIEPLHAAANIGEAPSAIRRGYHLVDHGVGKVVGQIMQPQLTFPQRFLGLLALREILPRSTRCPGRLRIDFFRQ